MVQSRALQKMGKITFNRLWPFHIYYWDPDFYGSLTRISVLYKHGLRSNVRGVLKIPKIALFWALMGRSPGRKLYIVPCKINRSSSFLPKVYDLLKGA